jgi:RecA/RadA recombinase
MGGRPGLPPQETSPGGKALKFYASLRLAYKQIRNVKGKAADALSGDITEQVIATYVKVRVTKNRIGVPFREAEVRVDFGRGFDNVWSALQVLLAHRAIRKDGAWYRFDPSLEHAAMTLPATTSKTGRPSIQGEHNVLLFAREYPDWGERLVEHATSLINEYGGAALAGTPPDEDLAQP